MYHTQALKVFLAQHAPGRPTTHAEMVNAFVIACGQYGGQCLKGFPAFIPLHGSVPVAEVHVFRFPDEGKLALIYDAEGPDGHTCVWPSEEWPAWLTRVVSKAPAKAAKAVAH